ncbi:MAG: membrane protein insertion efficiency factor YidD [Flavobacteriales bacterium]
MLTRPVILVIKGYQKFISPLLGKNCRYIPTCSSYMIEALTEWGLLRGMWMGIRRILRCHPWGGFGHDPVPKRNNQIIIK